MQLDLHQAAKQGDLETVLRLLEAKDVDVNALDAFDSTPLFYAALCGSLEVAELLLANGARCDACLLYTSPSPRDKRQSRMPSSA